MKETKQLSQNLRVLRARHPCLYARLSLLKPTIMEEASPHSFDSAAILSAFDEGMDFLYFFGLDAPDLLSQCAGKIVSGNRGILVIEPSWPIFHAAMRRIDMRPMLRSKRVFWAIGEYARDEAMNRIENTLCYAAAHPLFFLAFSESSRLDSLNLRHICHELKQEVHRKKSDLLERLDRLPETLRRPRREKPRIWSFEDLRGLARYSTIQHALMRTLHRSLSQLGYETEYLTLRDGEYYPPYYRILRMALFEPDAVFLCNRSPSYDIAIGAKTTRSLPIPMLTWFADDPFYAEHLLERNGVAPNEHFLAADLDWRDTLLRHGAREVGFMPGAATQTRRGRRRSRHVCDLVFVGQVRDLRSFFAQLSPDWRIYCEKVIEQKLNFPRKNVRAVMDQFAMPSLLPADRLDELRQKILWEANTRFRLRIAALAANYDLRLFGNEDWAKLLPENIHKRCFFGPLRRQKLFEVYRNARITLNIHSLQSATCLNVRDFDAPASGGFLLSDWLPKADEVFKPGFLNDLPLNPESRHEAFFYRSLRELKPLIEYFLNHEEERLAVIERARRRVLAEHTYAHRAEFLHNIFQRLLNESM